LVASFGISRIKARPSPTVAHIATGSEITPLGTRRRPGQIIDSNSPLVAALVAESHAKMLFHGRADETCDALTSQIATALDRKANVILVSGGASVGEHDHTRAALEQSGFTVHFHSINCRPGRPLIFATRGRTVAFGLPGNPLSHLVCFKLFVDRALRRLDGRPPNNPVPVSVAPPHPRRNSRETWWPANITAKHGALRARFLPWRDSSDLSGIATANGLVRVPATTPPKEAILWAPPHP
jgi:molybdopterin molybdotransferase